MVGGWRLAAAGGWRQLAVGGWWQLAVGGGWWLAGDGPLGRSLRAVRNKLKKKSRSQRTALHPTPACEHTTPAPPHIPPSAAAPPDIPRRLGTSPEYMVRAPSLHNCRRWWVTGAGCVMLRVRSTMQGVLGITESAAAAQAFVSCAATPSPG